MRSSLVPESNLHVMAVPLYDRSKLDAVFRRVVLNDAAAIATHRSGLSRQARLQAASRSKANWRYKNLAKSVSIADQSKLAQLERKYGKGKVPWSLHPANKKVGASPTHKNLAKKQQWHQMTSAEHRARQQRLLAEQQKAARFAKIRQKKAALQREQWQQIDLERRRALARKNYYSGKPWYS